MFFCQFKGIIDDFVKPETQKSLLRAGIKDETTSKEDTLKYVDTHPH